MLYRIAKTKHSIAFEFPISSTFGESAPDDTQNYFWHLLHFVGERYCSCHGHGMNWYYFDYNHFDKNSLQFIGIWSLMKDGVPSENSEVGINFVFGSKVKSKSRFIPTQMNFYEWNYHLSIPTVTKLKQITKVLFRCKDFAFYTLYNDSENQRNHQVRKWVVNITPASVYQNQNYKPTLMTKRRTLQ